MHSGSGARRQESGTARVIVVDFARRDRHNAGVTGDETSHAQLTWTEVDGVAVVHVDDDGPLRASLVFRIGKTDEYLHANGITHLVEHLALYALGQPPHYQNGSVRTCITTFDTMGDDEQVIAFLRGTCEALTHLDATRLEAERRVLEVEARQRGTGLSSELYTWRYGASGPGLWGLDEYAVRGTSAEAVQAWADHVFRAENAVLLMSGPPPAGLSLPLRHGARLPVPALEPVLPETPAQFTTGRPAVGGMAAITRSVAASSYSELLKKRLVDRLRRDLAVSYSPEVEYDRYDATTAHLIVVADIHPDHLTPAASALVQVVDEMATAPVDAAELAAHKNERRTMLGLLDPMSKAASEALSWLLTGESTPWDAYEDEFEGLTADDLLEPARQTRDGMLYAVPAGAELDDADIPQAPRSSLAPELGGKDLVRSTAAPAGSRLKVSDEGVERWWADGTRATVRYSTCRALLAYPSGQRVLIAPDATVVAVEPAEWVGGKALVTDIDARASHVLVPMTEMLPTPTEPARTSVPSRTSWIARLALGILSAVGGLVMLIAATDPAEKDKSGMFVFAGAWMWFGAWLIRGAWRDRGRERAARAST